MKGVIVNTVAVIIGSLIGLVFNKNIPEKFTKAIMTGISLCVLYIGISGALKDENTLILIFSMVIGAAIGTLLDIDGFINSVGDRIEAKFAARGNTSPVAQGFVSASLLFCVGAMTIVGSLNAGLGDNEMLYTKSLLDFISAIMLTISLGIGVMLASGVVLALQGALALFAGVLAPVLSTAAIDEAVAAGSLVITAMGLNMLGITKIKVADYLPAIIIAPIITLIFT